MDVIFYKKIGKSFASSEKYCTFAAFFCKVHRMHCAVYGKFGEEIAGDVDKKFVIF